MKPSARGTAEASRGWDVAVGMRDLLDRLDAELRHPQLAPRLSSLAVRGVILATGWSLEVWRDRVAGWCATMERTGNEATTVLRPAADEWVKRLRKLRSFLATAGKQSRHIDDSADDDAEAVALFGDAGQAVVADAIDWFSALDIEEGSGAVGAVSSNAPAVSVTSVTKRYGEVVAVDDVSLTIPRGQIFGLLGPNGAGKTTLIECIEGIRTPDSGSVSVLGLDHRHDAKQIKTRIGVQLQRTGFYDLLSLRETLQLYASFYPARANVDALMARLEIRDTAKTRVKDLSGGILQRMSLGVALVNDPELLFLDEPTTGLDPQARHVIWEVVRSLQSEGKTVVLTTHYMDEAEQLCDWVAVMTAGRIRAQGSPSELIRQYVGESIVEISRADGLDEAALGSLPGVREHIAQGERFVLRSDDPAALLTSILALPVPPAEARIRRGTLEDVFLTIAERTDQP